MSVFPEAEYNPIQKAIIETMENAMQGVALGLRRVQEMYPPSIIILSSLPSNRDDPLKAHSVAELFVPGMEDFTSMGLKMKLANERAVFYALITEGWTLPQEMLREMTDDQKRDPMAESPARISCINIIAESVYGDRAFLSYAIDEKNGRAVDLASPMEARCWNDNDEDAPKAKGQLSTLLPRFPSPDASRGPVH